MKLLAAELDHETGIATRLWQDADGELWSEELHDAQDILDLNHQIAAHSQPGKDVRLAASIPPLVMNEWMTAWVRGEGPHPSDPEWDRWLRRKLNDPDNRRFRIHGGYL